MTRRPEITPHDAERHLDALTDIVARAAAVTLATSFSSIAQRIKGEGDGKATAIYARAYEQNPEFYAFYRSLEAYRQSFKSKSDVLVIEPNSEFFKYLKNSKPPK